MTAQVHIQLTPIHAYETLGRSKNTTGRQARRWATVAGPSSGLKDDGKPLTGKRKRAQPDDGL